jgi:putative ABC transport system permease protein
MTHHGGLTPVKGKSRLSVTDIPKFFDLLRVSLRQVVRHRMRYLGVVLAISLGTCGFIMILTVGRDVKHNLNQDLDLLGGATRIKVYFEKSQSSRDQIPKPQWFKPQAIDALSHLPGVRAVSAVAIKPMQATSTMKGREHHFRLVAVDEVFWEVNSFSPVSGQLFGAEAVHDRLRVCVLGADLARLIFGRLDVAGLMLPIDRELYQITGVLGGTGTGERVRDAFIPLTTGQDRVKGLSFPEYIYVRCGTWDDVGPVAQAIPLAIQALQPDERISLEVAWDQLIRVQRIAWWVEIFIYLSILATMVLGGMGIWNGMMATVQSRTREIGLKKAIGAEDRDILIQFLSEALFLSFGSALIGIALGKGGVLVVGRILSSPPSADLFLLSLLLSVVFSLLLGVGAGFAPSLIASRMEVVSALRYE